MILVILAAGMGTRYGGLKQMDPVSPEGDTIMDFSIYDAIQSGFSKVVFVIRKETEILFRSKYDPLLSKYIEVEYAIQRIENIPKKYDFPNRQKPWGTGHAVLSAQPFVDRNFTVINADDFYGRKGFSIMAKALKTLPIAKIGATMVGFQLKNTVSKYGTVSRGECFLQNRYLKNIVERTKIGYQNNIIFRMEENQKVQMPPDMVVSMNFWGFSPPIFDILASKFDHFLSNLGKNTHSEFFLPTVVDEMVATGIKVPVKIATDKWLGVTYLEDKKNVEKEIAKLKRNKVYPKYLWS